MKNLLFIGLLLWTFCLFQVQGNNITKFTAEYSLVLSCEKQIAVELVHEFNEWYEAVEEVESYFNDLSPTLFAAARIRYDVDIFVTIIRDIDNCCQHQVVNECTLNYYTIKGDEFHQTKLSLPKLFYFVE